MFHMAIQDRFWAFISTPISLVALRPKILHLNSCVTEIGGCERIQTNVNSSVFGMDCHHLVVIKHLQGVLALTAHWMAPPSFLLTPILTLRTCSSMTTLELSTGTMYTLLSFAREVAIAIFGSCFRAQHRIEIAQQPLHGLT
jgi:hypothetical protein